MAQPSHTFFLKTGWFIIQVDCTAVPVWLDPLQQRYAHFLTCPPSTPPALHISLQPGVPSTYPQNKAPDFTPHGVTFAPPGWEGELDFAQKTGWVRPGPNFFIEETDYFLRVACAIQAFRTEGLLFHAAGILRGGEGYLFFGHSGAGKTTIARLSGERAVMNDDLVLLRPEPGGWVVYGTPFYNPTQVIPSGNFSAPLVQMLGLVQDQDVYLENASPGHTLAEIVANVPVISTDARCAVELLTRCQKLIAQVPAFRLHFRKDDSFWAVIENRRG
ncbi:MAG: hypothetical protein HUU38_01295 [Anaerolineales bacterium]|nr:hypothetical protein [Anaerolineales bacterium]